MDAETGESTFDTATGTFPYGTLSKRAATVVSPAGVTRHFLGLLQGLQLMGSSGACGGLDLFVDIGCGKGSVLLAVARDVGCPCLGVDISPRELAACRAAAEAVGVGGLVTLAEGDYRAFAQHLPNGDLSRCVCYLYLIPVMVNNRDFAKAVTGVLERGATVVCWQYLPKDGAWPFLCCDDETMSVRVYNKRRAGEAAAVQAGEVAGATKE